MRFNDRGETPRGALMKSSYARRRFAIGEKRGQERWPLFSLLSVLNDLQHEPVRKRTAARVEGCGAVWERQKDPKFRCTCPCMPGFPRLFPELGPRCPRQNHWSRR